MYLLRALDIKRNVSILCVLVVECGEHWIPITVRSKIQLVGFHTSNSALQKSQTPFGEVLIRNPVCIVSLLY